MTYPQNGDAADGFEVEGGRFVMVPIWALEAGVSDGAFRLYCVLADYGNRSGRSWPGRQALADRLGKSVDTVDDRARELQKAKLLTKTARRNDAGDPTSNLWILRTIPVGKSSEGGRGSSATGSRKSSALTRTNYEQEANERALADGGARSPVENPASAMLTARQIMERDAAELEADGGVARLDAAKEALAQAREILKSKGRHPGALFDERKDLQ